VPPAILALAERAGITGAALRDGAARLHRSGVRLVAGSDVGIGPAKPHGILPAAISEYVHCGIPAATALAAATSRVEGVVPGRPIGVFAPPGWGIVVGWCLWKEESMKDHEFLARVRERGEYGAAAEAEQVTRVVLAVLARRLDGGEVRDLAAQLPADTATMLTAHAGAAESFGVQEFLRQVAEGVGATQRTAQWDASAVLSTVADAVSGGELNDVLSQLPSGFAALFGRPALAG